MRQAGRYLPEYRDIRARAGSFLELCYTPALAAEVSLQPIRRYGFDAAIVFSDILVVADALGQAVEFGEGSGPRLAPIRTAAELLGLRPAATRGKFERVWETVARLRQDLPPETALIGFCGAPWTLATYMVGGGASADQAAARLWGYRDPQGFAQLIELLVETSIAFLIGQIAAGAHVLQIFDTWAGSLPDGEFARWVVAPTRRIVDEVRSRHPQVPIIGFPRGAGSRLDDYVRATGVQGLSCDAATPVASMAGLGRERSVVVQGNIDPLVLLAGAEPMDGAVDRLLQSLEKQPFICNLGHGIRPETPPAHVARLVERVRGQV
jgi:uroporphyrinogen decarboxylase